MLYSRGDVRYIAIVAPHQAVWIHEHLELVRKNFQVRGVAVNMPSRSSRFDSWEWTIEEGRDALVWDGQSSGRRARLDQRAR